MPGPVPVKVSPLLALASVLVVAHGSFSVELEVGQNIYYRQEES